MRGTADMQIGLSEVARARGDLLAAAEHVRRSDELGDAADLGQNPYRSRVAAAGLRRANGDLDGARRLLVEAVQVYNGDFSPDVRPVPAQLARVLVAQGDLDAAWAWARERGLAVDDELDYLREYEHVTLARILLADRRLRGSEPALREATELLERLLAAAETGGRAATVIEVLALQAQAQHAAGDRAAAFDTLERAVTLAEPEGWVSVFTDEPAPLTTMLAALARRSPDDRFLRRLTEAAPRDAPSISPATPGRPALVDPLSERELVVLRLLGSDLDGPMIARELVVSLNTVRTHTKHIYTKLGVNNRRAAVRRADELDLLSRTRNR
jgi:LuxR family maltose regulon positive regulatory protein